ncbi:MAG: glutamate--tRNA ligase [Candidatus Micrarchaeota archaeon]|nr:glutamate--tRNA ligase [Candidatus Micrarchaeota archaeon]
MAGKRSLEETIRKYTLKNAADYKLAIPAKVVGKVIGEFPDAKNDMKATMRLLNEEAKRVNSLTHGQVAQEMKEFEYAERKEEKKELELPGAIRGHVLTRFPPEPSGYPHIGHAKAAWLDCQSALNHGGKMLLRFDDTNPEKEKQEYVTALKDGLAWLGIEWSDETYTSDRVEELYTYCDELFVKYKAYVCTCSAEAVKKGREEKKECDCTAREPQENMALFRKMRDGKLEEGAAVVRFRGDMHSENTVMRDPTLFRIIKAPHYRQGEKYKCWPSYDFSAPILDSVEGITHAMRTKEYELRDELYFAILKILELRRPHLIEFSRLSIQGAPISKRLITPLIEQKKVEGWDDPRLPTLKGLARRGMLPEAVKTFVLSFGISKVESEPSWDALLAENRKLLDERCMRRYFVRSPAKLAVEGAPAKEADVPNHPKNAAMGKRKIAAAGEFYIAGADADALAVGETFRLKELYNLVVAEKQPGQVRAKYDADEGLAAKKIQWVPVESAVSCKVRVAGDLLDEAGNFRADSLSEDSGFCEASCRELAVGDIVQLERYGYARMDKLEENGVVFIFSC